MAIRQPTRLLLLLLTLVMATVTLGGVATAAPMGLQVAAASPAPYPPVPDPVPVTPPTVPVGNCTVLAGKGFAPGSAVTITDNGVFVATVVVDASGSFSKQVCFTTRCGSHQLIARGVRVDGTAMSIRSRVSVLCAVHALPSGPLARTGVEWMLGVLLAGSGLTVGGLVLRALGSPRRARTS